MRTGCRIVWKKVPENWGNVLGEVVHIMSIAPSELYVMDGDEILFWHEQAVRLAKLRGWTE